VSSADWALPCCFPAVVVCRRRWRRRLTEAERTGQALVAAVEHAKGSGQPKGSKHKGPGAGLKEKGQQQHQQQHRNQQQQQEMHKLRKGKRQEQQVSSKKAKEGGPTARRADPIAAPAKSPDEEDQGCPEEEEQEGGEEGPEGRGGGQRGAPRGGAARGRRGRPGA